MLAFRHSYRFILLVLTLPLETFSFRSNNDGFFDKLQTDNTATPSIEPVRSYYEFDGHSWKNLSFDERWAEFRSAVPHERLQPQCVPLVHGPATGEHLLILLHGWTACPGLYQDWVQQILGTEVACGERGQNERACGGYFRVMLPLLPGHGRKWSSNMVTNVVSVARDDGGGSQLINKTATNRDDIADLPTDAKPYDDFVRSIGLLALSFRQEHPHAIIAIGGHSLGGLLAARNAVIHPRLFDRVLLMNPVFGSVAGVHLATKLFGKVRVTWDALGEECEEHRGSSPGGICQILLSNTGAFVSLSARTYCKEWGIERCFSELLRKDKGAVAHTEEALHQLSSLQIVMTQSDEAVDNGRIRNFADEVARSQAKTGRSGVHVCALPKEATHSWFGPEKANKLFGLYMSHAITGYLCQGNAVPTIGRVGLPLDSPGKRGDLCLPPNEHGLDGLTLKVLPAVQGNNYLLGNGDGSQHMLNVLFHGLVQKESEVLGEMHIRDVELLEVQQSVGIQEAGAGARTGDPRSKVLVTRLVPNAGVRGIFMLRQKVVQRNDPCAEIAVVKLNSREPLLPQILQVDSATDKTSMPHRLQLEICSSELLAALCQSVICQDTTITVPSNGQVVFGESAGTSVTGSILFWASAMKESEHANMMHLRRVALMSFNQHKILLTYKLGKTDLRGALLIEAVSASSVGDPCASFQLRKLNRKAILSDLMKLQVAADALQLRFCGRSFINGVCQHMGCRQDESALYRIRHQDAPFFSGQVVKESENLHAMRVREVELLKLSEGILLFTRKLMSNELHDTFRVEAAKLKDDMKCVVLTLAKLKVEKGLILHVMRHVTLKFCSEVFVAAVCMQVPCAGQSVL